MYNTYIRRGDVSKKASAKDLSGQHVDSTFDRTNAQPIPKVCDQKDTAPVWGYILRQRGLIVILETSLEKALDRSSTEMPDLVVIDIDVAHQDPMELYQKFREVSVAPILLFLPTHHEIQILEAYAAGVDEVVIKPISPDIFLAKIMAWVRRSWTVPVAGLSLVKAGRHRLDPARRCLLDPARLSHMLIAACLTYLWMICQGLQVIAANQTALIDRTERIDKSLVAGNWTKYALKHRLDFQPLFQFEPLESPAHVRLRNLKKVRNCSI